MWFADTEWFSPTWQQECSSAEGKKGGSVTSGGAGDAV